MALFFYLVIAAELKIALSNIIKIWPLVLLHPAPSLGISWRAGRGRGEGVVVAGGGVAVWGLSLRGFRSQWCNNNNIHIFWRQKTSGKAGRSPSPPLFLPNILLGKCMQQLRLKQQDRIHENCIWFYTETNPKHKNKTKNITHKSWFKYPYVPSCRCGII